MPILFNAKPLTPAPFLGGPTVLVQTRLSRLLGKSGISGLGLLSGFGGEFCCENPPGCAWATRCCSKPTQKCDCFATGRWKRTTKKGSERTLLESFLNQA